MKNLIVAILLILPNSLIAQNKIELPQKGGNIFYEGVVNVDSVNKESLYQRAKLWMVNTFKNSKRVLETDNMELGQLTGKGIMPSSYAPPFFGACVVSFIININTKDGKYRYQLYDFTCAPVDPTQALANQFPFDNIYKAYQSGEGIMYWRMDGKRRKRERALQFVSEFNNGIQAIIASLKKGMQSDNNSNW